MKLLDIIKKTGKIIAFQGKKHSPELLLGGGLLLMAGGVVFACKGTLKVNDILDEHQESMNVINKINDDFKTYEAGDEIPVGYSDAYLPEDYIKNKGLIFAKTTGSLFRAYTPAIGLFVGGAAMVIFGHKVLKTRYVATVAAYNLLQEGFNQYRERVVESLGSEKDQEFRHGLKTEKVKIKETDEDGKEKTVTKDKIINTDDVSIYARWFDESSPRFDPIPEYNLLFLKSQQAYFNNKLQIDGCVFLNDVYKELGLPRTKAGSIVGWAIGKDKDGNQIEGDDFIDFGLYEKGGEAFINGEDNSILLDFNVNGLVYDLLEE